MQKEYHFETKKQLFKQPESEFVKEGKLQQNFKTFIQFESEKTDKHELIVNKRFQQQMLTEKIKDRKNQLRKKLNLNIPVIKNVIGTNKSALSSGDKTATSMSQIITKKLTLNNKKVSQKNIEQILQKIQDNKGEKQIQQKKEQVAETQFLQEQEKLKNQKGKNYIEQNYDNQFQQANESPIYEKENFNKKYKIVKEIGQGAHSVVYKCRNISTNQFFAAKISTRIDQQMREMMIKQYKLLKVLDHKDVLKVHELIFQQSEQKIYMISQLCQYKDLRVEMVRRFFYKIPFTQAQVLEIVKSILQTLNYVQAAGICHRDIKPQNILYNPLTKQIKLIDFDISKQKFQKKEEFMMWTTIGSLHYRAPQSFFVGFGEKVDVWGTGIILYQLLTGKVPFDSQYVYQTQKKIKNEKINFDTIKCSLKSKILLKKMLEKDPKQRFSCKQCLNFLQNQYSNHCDDSIILQKRKSQNKEMLEEYYEQKYHFQETDLEKKHQVYRIKMDFLKWNMINFQ